MSPRELLSGIGCGVLLCAGCASVGGRPEIRQVRPRITAIDLQGVSIAFDVDVHNPYLIPLKAPRFNYAVDIESNEFISSQSPVEVNLPAAGVGTICLPASFRYQDLWRTYRAVADAAEVGYELRGSFPVSVLGQSFEVPISHAGRLPVLRLPSVSMGKVDVADVSTSGAKIAARAKLRNPNIFALGVNKLGYSLTLGEVAVGGLSASTTDSIAAGATGDLDLSGEITARSALLRLLQGGSLGTPKISFTGAIQTPYGPVPVGTAEPAP